MRKPVSHPRPSALVLTGIALLWNGSLRAADTACAAPTESVRVAAIVDDLDVALEDGRTLRLAGLDPARPTRARPDLGETARRGLEARLVGRDIAVAILSPVPDRWERFSALMAPPAPANPGTGAAEPQPSTLNESLIREGWARVRPEGALQACLTAWLWWEAEARSARRGLWADPFYSILRAEDRQGLKDRTGAMVLVEGRARLGQSGGRLVFRFGDTGRGFVAMATRSIAKNLARAGIDPHGWNGAFIRIRGFLDDRFGPRIDVTDAGQIEILDAAPPARPQRPATAPDDPASQDAEGRDGAL